METLRAKSFGGPGWDHGNSITVDPLGNVYTAGQFGGPADFDPGPGVFTLTTVLGGLSLSLIPTATLFGQLRRAVADGLSPIPLP